MASPASHQPTEIRTKLESILKQTKFWAVFSFAVFLQKHRSMCMFVCVCVRMSGLHSFTLTVTLVLGFVIRVRGCGN